jgi:hypothetical protein
MNDFLRWRQFDYGESEVQLWVFKKSTTAAKYRAWHVRTDREVEDMFRRVIGLESKRITESLRYTPLSQNNGNSCLIHLLKESEGLRLLLASVDVPENENVDAQLKQLTGAAGYLVKFQAAGQTVYAVKKAAPTWKSKVRMKMLNAIFKNGELSAAPSDTFTFEDHFDFYCLGEAIFVISRGAYESTAGDRTMYAKSFDLLTKDKDFLAVVSDVEPFKRYVGNNATHLKRMTAIKQKGLYARHGFAERVRKVSEARGWGIVFDEKGRIVLSENTARVVLHVLLDHRLLSEITETTYDVPDAEAI